MIHSINLMEKNDCAEKAIRLACPSRASKKLPKASIFFIRKKYFNLF